MTSPPPATAQSRELSRQGSTRGPYENEGNDLRQQADPTYVRKFSLSGGRVSGRSADHGAATSAVNHRHWGLFRRHFSVAQARFATNLPVQTHRRGRFGRGDASQSYVLQSALATWKLLGERRSVYSVNADSSAYHQLSQVASCSSSLPVDSREPTMLKVAIK